MVTWLQRLRAWLATLLAVVIILAAVLVGVGRMLIPYADHARPWLEQELSERIGYPLSFDSVDLQWPRLTPRITLNAIRLGDRDQLLVTVDQAHLELHLRNLVRDERNLFNLVVLGLDLALIEDEDGYWGMRLEGGGQLAAGNGRERPLAGDLTIRDARVRVVPARLPATVWKLKEADIQRTGDQTIVHGILHPEVTERSMLELRLQANHPQERIHSARAWARIRDLSLDKDLITGLLPEGVDLGGRRIDATLWLDWSAGVGARVDVEFGVHGGRRAEVNGHLRAEQSGRRIDGELVELTVGGEPVATGLKMGQRGRYWALAANRVNLERLHALVEPWAPVLPWWPGRLSGNIEQLDILFESRQGLHALGGRVSNLELSSGERTPGVSGLDVELSLAGDRMALAPSGTPRIDWPHMLRQPVDLDRLSGRVLISPHGIEMVDLAIGHAVIDARADGWIYLGEGRPFLDFAVAVDRVESDDPRAWLPHGLIPDTTLAWLDQALTRVGLAAGGLLFHMRAGHKAADFEPGDFQAWIDFEDAGLDYWPDWPVAEGMAGRVDFVGNSLFGRIDAGRIGTMGLAVDQAVIPNLTEPELFLLVIAEKTEAGALAEVLREIPVPGWATTIEPMQWSGPVSWSTEITLPFRRMVDWDLDGEISFDGVDFRLPELGVGLEQLEGAVAFDRRGIRPAVVQAMVGQHTTALDLVADFEGVARLQLGAALNPAHLALSGSPLAGLTDYVVGASHWQLDLSARETGGMNLRLHSDLAGLGIELPAPLNKIPSTTWPLAVDGSIVEQRLTLNAALAERLDLRLDRTGQDWRLGLGFGGTRAQLPEVGIFDLRGHLERIDLRPWVELYGDQVNDQRTDALSGRAALRFDRLQYGDLYVEDVDLSLARDNNVWLLDLAGESVDGSARIPVPMDSGRVLAIDFNRLHLNDASPDPADSDLDIQQGPGQTSTASPTGKPPLHLLIEDLRYESLALGRVRVEAHAVRDGMEFEQFNVDGPALRLQGLGRWIDTEDGPYSEFDGRLITDSLTGLLATLGYESGIEAAHTQLDLNGRWPGAPHDFSLRRLAGKMRLHITDGLIPEARPGAGRLLGLASISTIPRRLMLDFRDVFAQGLKFDQIEGNFLLGSGMAVTDDLTIDAPAARILVTGSTDMVARQYDQHLLVEPGVGATLPIIGVIAGGPAGAAAGLVLQTLLDRTLRGITEARYSVTGSWDSPEVELVEARVADEEGDEVIAPPD